MGTIERVWTCLVPISEDMFGEFPIPSSICDIIMLILGGQMRIVLFSQYQCSLFVIQILVVIRNKRYLYTPSESPGETITVSLDWVLFDDLTVLLIVPARNAHGSFPNVGVTGAGCNPELNASERRRCPRMFCSPGEYTSFPKATTERLYSFERGITTDVNLSCRSSTELC